MKRKKIRSDMEVKIQDNSGLGKLPQKMAVANNVDHNPEVSVRATLNKIGRFFARKSHRRESQSRRTDGRQCQPNPSRNR